MHYYYKINGFTDNPLKWWYLLIKFTLNIKLING